MKRYSLVIGAAVCAAFPVSAAAGGHQIIVIEDAASEQQFQAAVESFTLLGSEEFASSTLEALQADGIGTAMLAPGVSATHFPGGTDTTLGVTLQVNTLGGTPSTPSSGGILFASGPGVDNTGTVRVGPDSASHSLDLFIAPPDFLGMVRAVSFTAFQEGGGDAEIRLYDNSNNLLAMQTVGGLGLEETKRIGIVAPEEETIFRINYWVPGGFGDVSGINVHVIPEPAAAALVLAIGSLLFACRRRSRD